MAKIIPQLNKETLSRMTGGEKWLARRLEALLEDDYAVWYDIPVGKNRRYPDFIILHPARGLLFLEVKDWKLSTLKKISKSDVSLLTSNGLVTKPHPLEQARQYTYKAVDMLSRDPMLRQTTGAYKGNLIMPYGWGVVFTNISRKQIEQAIPDDRREDLLPDHLMIYQDEMTASADAECFQEQLWGMFNYQFGETLTLPQIDRIRWYLFPEMRIDDAGQADLFDADEEDLATLERSLPDIIKIMDIQQEQLARSLGQGHRVIHGVAGSGKTLILGYRCLHLAQAMNKPILVLCFNITLAAKLRAFISAKGIGGQVQVYHFHDWCGQQIKTYHVDMVKSDKPYWERQVDTVIRAVDKGQIPRAQYGALLIDEGHDFEAEWLKLVTQMVDPETDSLLLLYYDAQSIYKKRSGLGFSLSSVGIRAQGRTTILKANYRNTREILDFAYAFARDYIDPQSAGDDHIPLIEPMPAGSSGPKPVVRAFNTLADEISFAAACLKKWHEQGTAWGDMAVLYAAGYQGDKLATELKKASLPHLWMASKDHKAAYQPGDDRVSLLTIHSSKGLEFSRVIMMGVGHFKDDEEQLSQKARLLYVGMTRAMECLLVTTSAENKFSRKLSAVAVQ
ncbi:3'-5' exonuclease [Candidatus Thiosymbion oneisti]|uniref:3'-5' exonuclease n=1 Tax=Candidatus Thiosymbion oneisti TaxID=589554 RepID=UPI000B279384|nr:3'-5' exonuclease [Candidatus Thiosymbion oneisti]